jgi:D-alanyl-D-alanine carboxypeptidase
MAAEKSDYVYNYSAAKLIKETNSKQQRPMASLTKLMTALIVVESDPDWTVKIKYKGNVFFNRMVSKEELLESLLIRSDNNAAEAFADAWPGGRDVFIHTMNARAENLGMINTHYDDPSGLSRNNVSTAEELARLVIEASRYDLIRNISSSKYLTIEKKIGKKIKSVEIGNTNQQLLFEFDNIILSKTGFTNPAGRCLALMVDKQGTKYIIIILGEKNPKERADKARHLINDYATIQEAEKDRSFWSFFYKQQGYENE